MTAEGALEPENLNAARRCMEGARNASTDQSVYEVRKLNDVTRHPWNSAAEIFQISPVLLRMPQMEPVQTRVSSFASQKSSISEERSGSRPEPP